MLIEPTHTLVLLGDSLGRDEILDVEAICAAKLKSNAGRPPQLRALVGAILLRATRDVTLREAEEVIRHYLCAGPLSVRPDGHRLEPGPPPAAPPRSVRPRGSTGCAAPLLPRRAPCRHDRASQPVGRRPQRVASGGVQNILHLPANASPMHSHNLVDHCVAAGLDHGLVGARVKSRFFSSILAACAANFVVGPPPASAQQCNNPQQCTCGGDDCPVAPSGRVQMDVQCGNSYSLLPFIELSDFHQPCIDVCGTEGSVCNCNYCMDPSYACCTYNDTPFDYGMPDCERRILECSGVDCQIDDDFGCNWGPGGCDLGVSGWSAIAVHDLNPLCPVTCGTETGELCGTPLVDDDCDGLLDGDDADCVGAPEICGNGIDDDADPATSDTSPDDCVPAADDPDDEDPDCEGDKCSRCEGGPVDMYTREMLVGPHEDVRVASPQGGSYDLVFNRRYKSSVAKRDHGNDVGAGSTQEPYARVLGPGWRHSFDVRLILEDDAGLLGPPTDPADPLTVSLETPEESVRLYRVTNNVWGRVAGRGITAVRSGSTWTVTLENGDVLELVDGTGTGTALHPWNATDGYQARLRYVYPQGSTSYRIHLWHEQETTGVPSWACTEVVTGAPGCTATRGLLAAVGAEWKNGANWDRGASFDFVYTALTTGKQQYVLDSIFAGADRDDGAAVITRLADFSYVQAASPAPTWRYTLRTAASCVGRTSGGTENTTCDSVTAHQRWRYTMTTGGTGEYSPLLALVEEPVMLETGISYAAVEDFSWGYPSGGGTPVVSEHHTLGMELSAPLDVKQAMMTWFINGKQNDVTFDNEWPANCSAGSCGHPTRPRVPAVSRADSRVRLGYASRPNQDGTFSLRVFELTEVDGTITYSANGAVLYEAEVVTTDGATPTMTIDTSSGTAEVVTFSGNVVTPVRRVSRHYYTTNSVIPREIARATRSNAYAGQPSTLRFPGESAVPASWRAQSAAASTRAVPVHVVSLLGANTYFDLDVFDADRDADGTLNEPDETGVVWTHRTRTDEAAVRRYSSDYALLDSYGRTTEQRSYAVVGTTAYMYLVGKSTIEYPALSATTTAHNRGRMSTLGTDSEVRTFTDVSTSASFVSWRPCDAPDSPFDDLGRAVCFELPQTPTALRTVITLSSAPTAGVRARTQQKIGATVLVDAIADRLASGFVVQSGTPGGTAVKSYALGGAATAAKQIYKEKVVATDTATVLTTTVNTYFSDGADPAQPLQRREQYDGDSATLRRKNEFVYDTADDDRRLTSERIFYGTSSYFTRAFTYDAVDEDRVLTETDVDETTGLTSEFFASGSDIGRRSLVKRGATPLGQFTYTLDGQVATVKRGTTTVATYAYAEDGRLIKETVNAAVSIERVRGENVFHTGGLTAVRFTSEELKPSGGATVRSVETFVDASGRPLWIKDTLGGTKVVEWFYDAKPTGYVGTWNTEGQNSSGGQREISITNNNQSGRLAYVKHPGGATFFEYDGAGRVTAELAYEATLPASFTDTLTLANLRTREYTIQNGTGLLAAVRYPSGRKVNYTYGTSDKRGPSSLSIANATNGIGTLVTVADLIKLDVDGGPSSWRWGGLSSTTHGLSRDLMGRVTSIIDIGGGATKATRTVSFAAQANNDGDPSSFTETGVYNGTLSTSASTSQSVSFAYQDADYPDALTQWDFDGITHALTLFGSGDGRRSTEVANGQTYTASYAGGEQISNYNAPGTQPFDINPGANNLGETTQIDYLNDGTIEIPSISYGPRGDAISVQVGTSLYTHARDDQMRRWVRTSGTEAIRERWNGGSVIDRYRTSGASWWRDEYVYLGGQPIGVTHTDNGNTTPTTYLLSTDTMGTPRRAFQRNTSLTQVTRLVMTAWGDGTQMEYANGDPALPFRYPGQLEDDESYLVENRWRTYVPGLGSYTTPDPEHRASVMMPGPQTYAYAHGNPLRYFDPTGRIPGQEFDTSVDAAHDALAFATGLTEFKRFGPVIATTGYQNSHEYGGAVCECCGGGRFYATKFVDGGTDYDVNTSLALRWCRSGDKPVARFHSHITAAGPDGQPYDAGDVAASRDQAHYVGIPLGHIYQLVGRRNTMTWLNAVDPEGTADLFRAGIYREAQFVQGSD
jgi:RHS repeat-associated protein